MATRIIEPMQIDKGVEDWIERLDQAIECACTQDKVTGDNKGKYSVSLLLANIGPAGYKVLKSYCAPDKPKDKTYKDLTVLLTTNLAPKLNSVSEAYMFNHLKQEPGEGLSIYMSRVKEKAHLCDFGAFYDRMVRDRFLYGLRDTHVRSYLLSKTGLDTAAELLKEAVAKENAMSANSAMSGSSTNFVGKNFNRSGSGGQKFPKKDQNRNSLVCSKCTLKGHKAADCKVKCRKCHKLGHIKANCYQLKRERQHNVEVEKEDTGHNFMLKVEVMSQSEQELTCLSRGAQSTSCDPVNLKPDFCNASLEPSSSVSHMGNVPDSSHKGNIPDSSHKGTVPDYSHKGNVPDNSHEGNDPNLPPLSSNSMGSSSINVHNNSVSKECTVKCLSTMSSSVNSNQNSSCELRDDVNYFSNNKPMIEIFLNGQPVSFELDTGAALTCMSKAKFSQLNLSNCKLIDSVKTLCVANGQTVNVSMIAKTSVRFNGSSHGEMPLHVVDSCFPTLLGRDWIEVIFGPDWFTRLVNAAAVSTGDDNVKFAEEMKKSSIFQPGIGVVKGYEARLDLKEGARPKFCKARVTAFSIRDKVETTLKNMISEGLLVPVDHSEWASPIVPVAKPDKSIRVCGDYKSTLNPALDTKTYPLPTVEECFASIAGGQLFTKIDIKSAYNSLILRKCDQTLTTMNTQLGLLMWTRLPFGINSAGAQF